MTDDYESGYQDGRFDGYYEAVAMLEEDYRDSENLAAELRAALEGAYSRLELIRTAYDRGFDRAYVEGCARAGVDEVHAVLRPLAGGESER